MSNVIGWSKSKLVEGKLAVLADTDKGTHAGFIGTIDKVEYFELNGDRIPYSKEETVLNNGRELTESEVKDIFNIEL